MAVQERGYQPQVGPARLAAMPLASANDFGAQVGEGISQVGGALERYRAVERQVKADQQGADASVKLEQWKTDVEQIEAAGQAGQLPGVQAGGAGYRAIVTQAAKERADKLAEGVTDPRVKNAIRGRVAAYMGDLEHRADIYERAQGVIKTRADAGAYFNIGNARLARATDLSTVADVITDRDAYSDSILNLNPEQKAAIKREGAATAWESFLSGEYGKADPAKARAILESGKIDALPDDVRERISNRLDVYEGRRAQADKAALREAIAATKESEDAYLAEIEVGLPRDPARARAIAAAREARGDKTGAVSARQSAVKAEIGQIFADAGAPEIRAAITQLDDKNDDTSVLRRAALQKILEKVQAADPVYAPVDTTDAMSYRTRERQVDAWSTKQGINHRVVLDAREVADYKEIADGGFAGMIKAADALAGYRPEYAMAAARQVRGKDDVFVTAVTLTPEARRLLLGGVEARRTYPAVAADADINFDFPKKVGGALMRTPPDYQGGVRKSYQLILAGIAAREGVQQPTDEMREEALHRATGGTWEHGVPLGGIGEWRKNKVQLPYRTSQQQFDLRLSRMRTLPDPAVASGQDISAADLRTFYVPTHIGGGKYIFIGRDGQPVLIKGRNQRLVVDLSQDHPR